MERRVSAIGLLVVFSLVSLIIISGCLDSFNPRLFQSTTAYDLQIQSASPIHNATFIIPLPVKDGIPMVGNKTLTADDFRQPGISATLTQSPPGLNLTGAVPIQDYQPWFVILRADELVPANGSSGVYSVEMRNIHYYTQLTNFRVIPNPVGTESLIVPKFNFTWKDPEVKKTEFYVIQYSPYRVPHDTLLYTDYQTVPSAHVTISFSYLVKNMWFEEYDDSFSNDYQDQFIEPFIGENHGWCSVHGSIRSVSEWNLWYPNATNPEWQQVLNHPLVDPYIPPYSS